MQAKWCYPPTGFFRHCDNFQGDVTTAQAAVDYGYTAFPRGAARAAEGRDEGRNIQIEDLDAVRIVLSRQPSSAVPVTVKGVCNQRVYT